MVMAPRGAREKADDMTPPCDEHARHITLEILDRFFGHVPPRDIAIRLWDGTAWPRHLSPDRRSATIFLNYPWSLRRMLLPPTDRTLGEAYLRGDFDITGDIEAPFQLMEQMKDLPSRAIALARLVHLLRQLPEGPEPEPFMHDAATLRGMRHSRQRDRAAVRYHYDVSNDFYALWLDVRMTYSCAYFETGDEDLNAAQEAKYDLICRKLRLRPGERLLDLGCGWGGLVIHAAERYGVQATGVTLSVQQAVLARQRVNDAGLTSRAHILLDDYRDLPTTTPYDKIVSVGMFEHVGRSRLPEYFTTAYRLLKVSGLFLNHGIARQHDFQNPARRMLARELSARASFVGNYVFPDGELVPISESLGLAERAGWEVRDVESLREHYARTLRSWSERLARQSNEAIRIAGPETYRLWRLFMAGAAHGFEREHLSVYQALLAKPDRSGNAHLPLTRMDIYADSPPEENGPNEARIEAVSLYDPS